MPQGLRRDRGARRRVVLDRAGERACAAGRERRRQVDDGQAAVRADAARRGQHPRSSASTRRLDSPRAAHALGIQTAFQEMTLVRDLTVLDNMLLPYAPMGITGTDAPRARRARPCGAISPSSASTVDLDAEVGDARPRRAPEDRDRARRLPQAAHPAARRADLDAGRAATSTGWAASSPAEGRAARPSSSSPTACARCAPSATR